MTPQANKTREKPKAVQGSYDLGVHPPPLGTEVLALQGTVPTSPHRSGERLCRPRASPGGRVGASEEAGGSSAGCIVVPDIL